MVVVDSKGRVVLPKEVREDLGITPGTEVEIHEEGGKAVVEPEDDPEEILDRMEELLLVADPEAGKTPYESLDPHSKRQVDAIRRQAGIDESECDDEGGAVLIRRRGDGARPLERTGQ